MKYWDEAVLSVAAIGWIAGQERRRQEAIIAPALAALVRGVLVSQWAAAYRCGMLGEEEDIAQECAAQVFKSLHKFDPDRVGRTGTLFNFSTQIVTRRIHFLYTHSRQKKRVGWWKTADVESLAAHGADDRADWIALDQVSETDAAKDDPESAVKFAEWLLSPGLGDPWSGLRGAERTRLAEFLARVQRELRGQQ